MKKSILIITLAATVASCGSSTDKPVVDTVKPVDTTKVVVDTVKKVDTTVKDTTPVK